MAVICVNTSSPEFKRLLEKTHFSEGTLKSIIHEYQNTPDLWEKNQGLWPSDDYVLNYFNRRFAGTPAQIAVWKGRFMSPHIYNTFQEANAEKTEASKWFNEESIRVYENADGKWVLMVSRPLDLRAIKQNSDAWLQDLQKDLNTTVNTGAYGRYIPRKNEPWKNVPAMDYLGKRLDNFYRQRGLKVQAYWSKNSQKWMVRYAPEEQGYVDDLNGGITDWTEGQKNAIDQLLNFLSNPDGGKYMLLEGAAGTGKTTLINEVLKRLNRPGRPHVLIGALSHKAKGVLDSKITKANKTKYMVEAKSLAGMLGMKMTMKNINGNWQEVFEVDRQARKMGIPIQSASIVFIDEASMVSEEAMSYIEELVGYGTKIVFLGDQRQLPPIRTGGTEFWNKHPELLNNPEADSPVFTRTDIPRVSLTERVRQGEDSPIHMVTDQFGNYTLQGGLFPNLSTTQSSKDLRLIIEKPDTKLSEQMLPLFQEGMRTQNPNFAKIVAFTNAKVNQYNMELHFLLHPDMAANRDMNFAEGDLITMYDSFTPAGAREPAVHNAEEGIVIAASGTQHMTTRTGADIRYRNYTIKMQDERTVNIPVLEQDTPNIQAYNTALEQLKKQAIADGGSWAWRPYYELKESMANMKMGYASTIHKSQGSTYQVVGVDTTDNFGSPRFKSQAIYTAMTRAANISIIKGMGSSNAAPSAEAISKANASEIERRGKKSVANVRGLSKEQIDQIHAETDELAEVIKQALKTVEAQTLRSMADVTQPLNQVKAGTIIDATDVLRMVIDSNATEQEKALAKSMIPLFSKMQINVIFEEVKDREDAEGNINRAAAGTTWNKRQDGGYDVRINTLAKMVKAHPAKTVLHELVHALTSNRLDNDAEFNRGVQELMDYVDMWLDQHGVPEIADWGVVNGKHYKLRRDIYGMYTTHEFLAEAMSNPYFQKLLQSIPAPDDMGLNTWQKFCKIIANALQHFFHTKFQKQTTVYDMLIPVIADAMVVTSEQEDRTAPFTEWNMDRTEQMMSNAYEVVKAMNIAVEDKDVHWTTEQVMELFGDENNQVPQSYEGMITPEPNTIFVFGSNPEGRHGAGAAKTAREKFGAIYGQGEGLQGNAYALPTKDLRTPDWARTSNNSYEVSSRGDSRFSALNAKFKQGTVLFGHDVSGRTIESVYQHGVKQGDWNTDNNSKTGVPKDKTIITGNTEDASYEQGYLPLWREWAKQNPELIEELSQKAHGKTLTDQFASTRVSQARALSDIIKDTKSYKSISPEQITENIRKMYEVARQNPDKQFKVAYTNGLDETTLNGYSGREMIKMFKDAGPIPKNVILSKNWTDHWNEVQSNTENQQSAQSSSTINDIHVLLKQKVTDQATSTLIDLVFGALDGSNIKVIAKDLGEGVSGRFVASENTIYYNPNAIQVNTLLHEATHAATSYYLRSTNNKDFPKEVQIAIKEIDECYELLKQDFIEEKKKEGIDVTVLGIESWVDSNDLYGYTSAEEMIAELSKPEFLEHIRDFDRRHKGENLFDKLINAIAKLFGINKQYTSLEKTVKDALVTILTNPSIELMQRYSKENATIKENVQKLKDSKSIIIKHRHSINAMMQSIPESDEGMPWVDTILAIPADIADSSINADNDKYLDAKRWKKGTILQYSENNGLHFILNGQITREGENIILPVRIYGWTGLSNYSLDIKIGENGLSYVDSVTPVFEEMKPSAQSSPSTGGEISVTKKGDIVKVNKLGEEPIIGTVDTISKTNEGFVIGVVYPDGFTRPQEVDATGVARDFSQKNGLVSVTTEDGKALNLVEQPKIEPTQAELFAQAVKATREQIMWLEGQIGWVNERIKWNQATSEHYANKAEWERQLEEKQQLMDAVNAGKAEVYLNEYGTPMLRTIQEKPIEKNIVVDDAYEVSPIESKKKGYDSAVILKRKNLRASAKDGANQIQRMIEQGKLLLGTHVMWVGLNTSELAALNKVKGLNKNEDGSWTVGYTEREMILKAQNDFLLNNPMFGNHELHKLAALTMFKLSETITQLQDGSVRIEDILMDASLTDEIRNMDFKGMDRIDIINAIGLDKLFKDVIREQIFNADINERLQEDFDLADKAQAIYDNFDAFIRLGYQELIELENISIDTERAVDAETDKKKDENGEDLTDEEVVALFGSTVEHWQVGFRQVSTFSSLSKLMKQYLNRIYVLDKEGNRVTDEYGVEKNIDAHEAVSKILKWTQGATDINDMIDKLERKVAQEPWVQQLVDLLNADGNEQLRSQFFSNFKKYFQKYNIIYKEKTKSGDTVTRVKTINRDPFVVSTLDMIKSLDNSKEMGSFNLWNPRTNSIDAAAVGSLKKGAEALEAILNYKKGGVSMDEALREAKIADIEKALNSLNIPMPTRELLIQTLESPNVVRGMTEAMNGLHKEFMKVPTGKSDYKFMNSKTQSNYTRLIEAFAPVMGDGLDSVSYEAGKLHYSYVTPSYLSKFVENMKGMRGDVRTFIESEYGSIEGWFRNKRKNANQDGGEGWLNYWLDRMMGDTEEAKNTREKFDHIVVLSDNGTAYASKSPVQYMASMLSMYLYDDHGASAYYRIPMMSNKPSEEYIKFDRIKDGYRDIITDWLVDKTFAQEINRIRAVNFRNNAPAELEKLRAKKNLTAEEQARKAELEEIFKDGMPAKISSFDKNGASFMFMEYLNQYVEDKDSELGALLRKKINGEKFDPATNESSRFTELLRQAVQDNIDAAFERFLRNLALEGLIQLSPDMNVIKVNAIQDKLPLGQAKERLEEFFWNDMFASMNIMQLLCTDIAYYKNTEDLQKRFAQWHSPGLRGDTNATIKGQKVTDGNTRSMYIADKIETSDIVETLKKVKEKVLAQDRFRDNAPAKALMAAQFDKVIKAFEDVNVTDAQAYTSPTGYRKKMAVFGQWTPRDEEVYQRILSGDFTAEDLDVMWQPLKPFVYSQIEKRGFNPYMPTLKMGVQQKNSEYCLILADALMRSAGLDSKLTAIFDFMEESHKQNPLKGIDTIMFNSAVKTGLMGTLDINDSNLSHDDVVNYLKDMSGMNQGEYDDRYVHTIPFDDYSIQQYNPAHFAGEQQMGSQNRVLVFADMPNSIDGVEQFIEVDGKKVSVKSAKIAYFKAIIDNIRRSGEAVKEEFDLGNKSKKMKNLAMMRALQREIVKDSRYGTDLQWACMLDDSGEFNIPLSDAIQSDRIQQLLNSIIKNRINKQEIAGGPLVQVSNYGTAEELKIVRNADGTIKYFECYAPAYDDQLYVDFGDGKGGIDMEKIRKANPKLLEMIGYRIPTEAKYSMAPLKIVGFLPKTAGEGIMLPKEITTLSGSDFDVDKMYIMRYQLNRTDNRNAVIKELEDEYKAAGRNGIASRVRPLINGEMQPRDAADHLILSSWRSKHKIEWENPTSGKYANDNLIIATQWGILTSGMAEDQVLSSGNFDEVKRIGYMMAAMDNGTEYDSASKMSIGSLKDAAYTNKYLQYADTQMQFHKQNMVAAKLIGVFAQSNVSHAIVGMSDVPAEIQIPEGGAMTINGQSYFENNRYIVDQEYGLDNATRISSLLAQLLAGSVDAVKDPVLNLLNINMDTVNVAVTLVRLGHDLEFIGLFLTHPIIRQLINRYNIEAASGSTNSLMQTLNAMQKELRGEDGKGASLQLQYDYDKGFFVREHNRSDRQDEAYLQYKKDMDLTVLELYKKLNNMAEMFRGVIHTTRYNSITSAVGPYASDTMNNRLSDEQFAANAYVTEEMKKAAEGIIYDENGKEISLIQAFRDTSSELERELLGDNMIQASEETYKVYKALKSKMGYMSQKMAKEFGRFYMSYYMNMEAPLFDLSDGHREEMLDRFPKQFVSKKNQYRDNVFVQAVMMDKDKAGNDILTINTRGLTDTEIQALRSGWADLYTSEKEKGIEDKDNLALKLVEYNFFLGSFGFSPKTFMSMTPNNVKLAIPGYKESLLKQLDMNQDRIDNLLIQFMLNFGYANLGTLKEKDVTFQSGDLIASREFDIEPQSVGLAKMQMNDGTTRWIYAEPINNSNDVRVYFVDKLGGENQQCFEIDPSRKVYEIESVVKNSEPESATTAEPDSGHSSETMVDDGRTVYQHLMPLLAAVKGGYAMGDQRLNMQNLQDRFNKLYNAGQQSFISSATGLSMDVIDKVAEVMGVTQEELLSDVQESENKLNLCK